MGPHRFDPRILDIDLAAERERTVEPDAAAYRAMVVEDHRAARRRSVAWLRREGRLASGWTGKDATDLLWALISSALMQALPAGLDAGALIAPERDDRRVVALLARAQ